jgi:transcription initiation factor IIE alpha subunit
MVKNIEIEIKININKNDIRKFLMKVVEENVG